MRANRAAKLDTMNDVTKKDEAKQPDNLAKGKQPVEQNQEDDTRVKTVVPDNDSGKPGAPARQKQDKEQE